MKTRTSLIAVLAVSMPLLVSGCVTTGSVSQLAKRAAVDMAKEKAVATVLGQDSNSIVQENSDTVQVQTAKKQQSGMLKMRKTVPDMKVAYGKPKKLAGVREFVVPFYRINYLTNSNYKNESNNSYTKATARVLSTLEGVSTPIFDEITEIVYADFKQKMTDAGYTLAPHTHLKTVNKYMAKSKYPSTGKSSYHSVPKGATFAGGGSYDNSALMVEMKDKVNVISVDLDANFVINNRNEKKFNFRQAKETVYTSQGANIAGTLGVRMPRTQITFEIGQPPYSQIAFGTMSDATTGGDKVGDTAVKLSGLLFGGGQGRRMTTKRKTVQADEARYKEVMIDALKQANTMMVNKMASYK
ncbi:MAG: hypothetical protein COA69_10935 [Robiginitomaculum sp.]|nr:MAG: hypothetical protein COA69_10935 [Robiginitomaculum sp.]